MTEEFDELCRKLKPVLGDRVDALWLEYQADPEQRKELEALLHLLARKHLVP